MAALGTLYPTLIDVSRFTGPDGRISDVADILQQENEILDDIPWIEGNLPGGHQSSIATARPTVAFRLLNQGVVPVKVTAGQIVDACGIIEARNRIDKDVAELNGNSSAFRLQQDKGIIAAMGELLATTLIYGDVSTDEEKFNGLASRYFSLTSTYTTYDQIIDAGGTGSDNTSIWLVGWAPDKVFGIYPKGSKAGLQSEDLGLKDVITNATTGATLRAYESWYQWKCGICVSDYRYVVRITNIDVSSLITASDSSDTSANLLKFMIQALGKLPARGASMRPVFYMNSTVQSMLAVKLLDKGNLFLTMNEVKNSPVFRPNGVLSFQGVPCRRIDAITSAEDAIS